MATIEERLQALEQEVAAHKHTEEMLTIAVRALVSKEAFEKLQETEEDHHKQNGKLFNVIINQNSLHNERITELDGRVTELDGKVEKLDNKVSEIDGKVIGLQTEMRQQFAEVNTNIASLQNTQTEHTTLLQEILARLPEKQ